MLCRLSLLGFAAMSLACHPELRGGLSTVSPVIGLIRILGVHILSIATFRKVYFPVGLPRIDVHLHESLTFAL